MIKMVNEKVIELLLIEDSKEDAELTLRSLRKINLGNNIKVLVDGEDALNFIYSKGKYADRIGAHNPKLILLDLKLPKIDGLEILRRLKMDENKKSIPVVVLTSSDEERDVIESYKLGVNSYIVKPVESENFIKAIDEIGLYWLLLNRLIK
jgi:two-component system, response regulator